MINENNVVISVKNVSKEFILRNTHTLKDMIVWTFTGRKNKLKDNFFALKDVSFDINEGESVALLGYNGSGKSTMLKLISGVMRQSSGKIGVKGNIAGLIEVGAGFHPDLTGRENVYLNGAILGMSKEEIDTCFDSIVAFSEIEQFIDTEVKFYSSGMFLRLAFAVAIHTDPDIFLIDEILAVGDENFRAKCLKKIKEFKEKGKSLVIVSHDLDMVSNICDRGVVLEYGDKKFDGPIDEAIKFMRRDK
ncbi:ABC transporter ATP-binding protein [Actinomyces sp. zg-332]|uniref:ABC transporter ATP-binding protein n=1 Tax=Actinomyces sp. zg-332 TaxID=2708340 RepID=UPI00141F1695|nr:ABC transporter ATP-binding protein [Actinomyces sp. zg-332]QPK94536.1 ABC transporter ATP-binding protein [Actinomyces sp. zg-332]